jgi:hypothetical protein
MSRGSNKQALHVLRRQPKNQSKRHEPLLPGDTPTQTIGCRHTNPAICAKNAMPTVCALARADGVCTAPPATWPKQYAKLLAQGS